MKHAPEQWRRAFIDDGFVIIQDLLDPALVSRLREGMDQIADGVESLRPDRKEKIFLERDHVRNNPQWYKGILAPEDCGGAVRQIADLGLFAPLFAELIAYPPLSDVLETLFVSPEFSFIQMVGRPKAARVGNGISNGSFHRDTPFADFTTADTITVLLSLDEMTGINGATSFIRGSHKVSDEEAAKPCWRDVPPDRLNRAIGWMSAARRERASFSRIKFFMQLATTDPNSRAERSSRNGPAWIPYPRRRFAPRIRVYGRGAKSLCIRSSSA